jgi:hypothetical protein
VAGISIAHRNIKYFVATPRWNLNFESEIPSDSSTSWKRVIHANTATMTGIPRLAMRPQARFQLLKHVACVFLKARSAFLGRDQ